MGSIQSFLNDLLYYTEGIVAVAALAMFKSSKLGYWKYFSLYLVIIFLFESLGRWGGDWLPISKQHFYNYLVIPFQFLFFYWLYAVKSLEKKTLFWILSILYLLSFIPSELFFRDSKVVYSFNYTFGCVLLMFLVVMEYNQQINSHDILKFYKNRMFYINLGVTVFYIGTLPFITFYLNLRVFKELWNGYYVYFMISGVIMYILFLLAMLWGRQNSLSR